MVCDDDEKEGVDDFALPYSGFNLNSKSIGTTFVYGRNFSVSS